MPSSSRPVARAGAAGGQPLHAQLNGANIPLPPLTQTTAVKFYYDDKSHWVTDNQTSVIAVAPGDFQHLLGCPGDWQPD